jgi:beta-mannanase
MSRLLNVWPLGFLIGFLVGHRLWLAEKRTDFLAGIYQYPSLAKSVTHSTIETVFVSWVDPKAAHQISEVLQRSRKRRSLPLITLEPFPDSAIPNGSQTLVEDVVNGAYQQHLDTLLSLLCRPDQSILLRFAHEMDHAGQYPWSVQKGSDYIRLYRSVWDSAQKPNCRNLYWVWSPAGNGDSRQFWPGNDAVDIIGVSVYNSPRWNANGQLTTFEELYKHRRWLHRLYHKPMLIAEMGISGEPDEQQRWLAEARSSITRFPELIGWVYFSAPQPRWIPLPTGHEDWSLPKSLLEFVTTPIDPDQS